MILVVGLCCPVCYRRGTSAPLPATLLWTRHLTGPHQPAQPSPAQPSPAPTHVTPPRRKPGTEKLWARVSPNSRDRVWSVARRVGRVAQRRNFAGIKN